MLQPSANNLTLDYDRDSDVLYISIGEPSPGVAEHLDDDILLRYSLDTGELIGVTVLGFRAMGGTDELVRRLGVPACAATVVEDSREAIRELVHA